MIEPVQKLAREGGGFGERLDILSRRRAQLIAYLHMKAEAADWHGVADAAMDLRELDIEIAVRSERQ